MVQETVEIPSVKEVPTTPATDEGFAPEAEPTPAEPQETAPETEAPETTETPSFDPSRYENDEAYKSFLDEKLTEARREGQKRERGRRAEVAQLHQANAQLVGTLNQGVESLFHRVNKAIEDGMDSDSIARAIAQHAPQLAQFAQWNESLAQQFRSVGAQETIGKFFSRLGSETGIGEQKVEKIVGQLNEDWQFDGGEEAFQGLVAEIKGKLEAPLKKKIAELEKALERGKADSRQEGPDTAQKTATGGRPTVAQYAAASYEQRKAWKEAGIDPQV